MLQWHPNITKRQMTFCFFFYNGVRYAIVFFSFIHNFCYYQWGIIGNRYVRVPFFRLFTALFLPFLNAYLTSTPSRSTWLFRSVGSLTLRKRQRGCGQSTNWRSCRTYVSTMYNNITKKLFNTFLFFFFFSMMSRTSGSLEKEQMTFRTIYKKTKELCNFL